MASNTSRTAALKALINDSGLVGCKCTDPGHTHLDENSEWFLELLQDSWDGKHMTEKERRAANQHWEMCRQDYHNCRQRLDPFLDETKDTMPLTNGANPLTATVLIVLPYPEPLSNHLLDMKSIANSILYLKGISRHCGQATDSFGGLAVICAEERQSTFLQSRDWYNGRYRVDLARLYRIFAYRRQHLKASLVIVLGIETCGAIDDALHMPTARRRKLNGPEFPHHPADHLQKRVNGNAQSKFFWCSPNHCSLVLTAECPEYYQEKLIGVDRHLDTILDVVALLTSQRSANVTGRSGREDSLFCAALSELCKLQKLPEIPFEQFCPGTFSVLDLVSCLGQLYIERSPSQAGTHVPLPVPYDSHRERRKAATNAARVSGLRLKTFAAGKASKTAVATSAFSSGSEAEQSSDDDEEDQELIWSDALHTQPVRS